MAMVQVSTAASVDTESDVWVEKKSGAPAIEYGPDGVVTVSFDAQSAGGPPVFQSAMLMANATVSGGAFVGNYIDGGIKGIYLQLSNSVPGCAVQLVLQSAGSGRLWRNTNVEMVKGNGQWVAGTVSLDRSAGWTRDSGDNLDAMWTQDLQNVAMVGVRVFQSGYQAQSCMVGQFMLKDSIGFVTSPANLTDLQSLLLARFDVAGQDDLSAEQLAQDVDGDGMSDVNELLAGTNPDSASSVFAAEIIEDETVGTGITISWPCVIGARYTVLRCTNLLEGMQNLVVGLVATESGTMTYHDATAAGEGPYFYRIRKD